jgi:hypothetical protein
MSMLGRVRGFKYGLIRGVKEGEGVARRYSERRARVSTNISMHFRHVMGAVVYTFMVGVEHILVRVAKSKLVRNWRLPSSVWRPPVVGAVC